MNKKQPSGGKVSMDYSYINGALDAERAMLGDIKTIKPLSTNSEYQVTYDAWINKVASIGTNNSILKESEFLLNRIGYSELANMSTDPIINRAIKVISDEMFTRGGTIVGGDLSDEMRESLNNYIKDSALFTSLRLLVVKALQYGGAFLYLDTNDNDLSLPLGIDYDTTSSERWTGVRVIEPWLVSPSSTEMSDPTSKHYMKPSMWYISGKGQVHSSRIVSFTMFDVPDLLKPMFNFTGISLTQLMSQYIGTADSMRQSVGDLFLRFRTMILKTNAEKLGNREYLARVKAINNMANNLGVLVVNNNEEIQQVITPVTGLDALVSQAYEMAVAVSSVPVNKLLGTTPRGFNSTGEFEMRNYYDTIANYQNTMLKPIIERLLRTILNLKFDTDTKGISYEFAAIGVATDEVEARVKNSQADLITKLVNLGVINTDEALKVWQSKDFGLNDVDVNSDDSMVGSDEEELFKELTGQLNINGGNNNE